MVVSLATFLEIFLNRLCYQVSLVTRSDLTARDLRGSMLERARKYLGAIGKFERPSSARWDEIDSFLRIRHVIVHVGGLTLGTNHQKAIERFSQGATISG
jgi:hypothetical protein